MKPYTGDTKQLLLNYWKGYIRFGNVIFLDGSVEGMQKTMKDMMALNQINQLKK